MSVKYKFKFDFDYEFKCNRETLVTRDVQLSAYYRVSKAILSC